MGSLCCKLVLLEKGFLGLIVSLRSSVGNCCLVCLDMKDSLDETEFLSEFFADLEKQEKAYGGTGYPVIV